MKRTDVIKILYTTLGSCEQLLIQKGHEYSGDDDALENFKRAGIRRDISPMAVLMIYMDKHLDSINQYVLDIQAGRALNLSEPIDGRIDDAINYLILLKALIHESAQTVLHNRDNGQHTGGTVSFIPDSAGSISDIRYPSPRIDAPVDCRNIHPHIDPSRLPNPKGF